MFKSFPFSVRLAGWLLSATIIIYGLYILRETLIPLTFSVLFAVLLYPTCAFLERWRFPRILAITLSIVLMFTVVGLLVYLASVQIVGFGQELPNLEKKANYWIDQGQDFLSDNFGLSRRKQMTEGRKYLTEALKNSASILTGAVATTTNTLVSASLVPLFVFFFLLYRDFFRNFFYKLFDSRHKRRVNQAIGRVYEVVQGYLVGLVSVIMIVGVMNSAGLLLLGVPHAIFFGFFAAFLLLIPYVGLMIGSLLPALMALVTKDSPMYAAGVLAVFGVIQFLEGNFITPNIVGSKVSINPLAAMIVLILGGQLWGVSGLILALPVTAIVKVIFDAVESLKPFGYLLGDAEE
ncbi:MAG: AI-2E family transporter [Spirosomaceae bacterium]|jgi:putative heme transporter|nr:AI-2E family transporter [Spirosomataceae bacterium]